MKYKKKEMSEMSNVGFRVFTKIRRPSQELVESFKGLPVANIADMMNRMFCLDAKIRPMNASPMSLAATAG